MKFVNKGIIQIYARIVFFILMVFTPWNVAMAQDGRYNDWHMGTGMMGNWGMGWFGGIFMMFFWVLIIVGLILFVRWLFQVTGRSRSDGSSGDSAQSVAGEHGLLLAATVQVHTVATVGDDRQRTVGRDGSAWVGARHSLPLAAVVVQDATPRFHADRPVGSDEDRAHEGVLQVTGELGAIPGLDGKAGGQPDGPVGCGGDALASGR